MKGRVLVTGATGAVGPAVVRALQERGWEVRALVRHDPPAGLLGDAQLVRGDLRDRASLEHAVEGVDAVVHAAALLHLPFAGPEHDSDFRALNVEATRALVEAARGKRFVFFSTIVVYGSGGPFTEESPVAPANMYARTKVEAERIVLAAGGTVLRLSAVYGRRTKGNYATLIRAIERGRFIPIGPGLNHRTLVHDSDVAQATLLALESADAAGKIYNVTDGTTHPLHAIIDAIARAVGRKPPRGRIPLLLMRAGAMLVPKLRRLLGKYTEDVRIDGSKLQRELGYRPVYGLEAGWREALS